MNACTEGGRLLSDNVVSMNLSALGDMTMYVCVCLKRSQRIHTLSIVALKAILPTGSL